MEYPSNIDAAAYRGRAIPEHDRSEQPPLETVIAGSLVHATTASGPALELTSLIPALARLAMESRDANACCATSLAGLGVALTATEETYLVGCAMRVLQSLLDTDCPAGAIRG